MYALGAPLVDQGLCGAPMSTVPCTGTIGCAPNGGQRRPQSSVAGNPGAGRGTSTPWPGSCARVEVYLGLGCKLQYRWHSQRHLQHGHLRAHVRSKEARLGLVSE